MVIEFDAVHMIFQQMVSVSVLQVAKLDKSCSCDESRLPARSMSSGWEGSAVLHNGSIIQIGCLQFAFHIGDLDYNGTDNQ